MIIQVQISYRLICRVESGKLCGDGQWRYKHLGILPAVYYSGTFLLGLTSVYYKCVCVYIHTYKYSIMDLEARNIRTDTKQKGKKSAITKSPAKSCTM